MEIPFSDKEKRFVLSEAIKTSSIPVEKLLTFINESDVQPDWQEILMPHGRNLNSCISVWGSLRAMPASSLPPVLAPERKRKSEGLESLQAPPQTKRRQSGQETMIRIQPKPSNGSPHAFSIPQATQAKKRGRPSKADIEARQAKAIARGEIIAPPRTLAARESFGGDAGAEPGPVSGGFGALPAIMPSVAPGPDPRMSMSSLQSGPLESESSDMIGKKKRGGRPGSRSSKEPNPGEGSFSNFGPPPAQSYSPQYEVPKPPPTRPFYEETSRPPPLPPKLEEGSFGAPVYPAIDALLSPEPPRPERSGP